MLNFNYFDGLDFFERKISELTDDTMKEKWEKWLNGIINFYNLGDCIDNLMKV